MKLEKRSDPGNTGDSAREEVQKQDETSLKKREMNVLVYMAVLFAVALGLIVLSYFIQRRANNEAITDMTDKHSEVTLQALKNIEELQDTNQQLMQEAQQREKELADLEDELESTREELQASQDELAERNMELTEKGDALDALEEELNGANTDIKRLEADLSVLRLYRAMREGMATEVYISELERLEEYLDDEYLRLYQELQEEMKGERYD